MADSGVDGIRLDTKVAERWMQFIPIQICGQGSSLTHHAFNGSAREHGGSRSGLAWPGIEHRAEMDPTWGPQEER